MITTGTSLVKADPLIKKEVKEPAVKVLPSSEPVDGKIQISFSKLPGQKWVAQFTGKVSRRDVNRLRTALLIHFNRMKRKARKGKMVAQLIAQVEKEKVKENSNAK